MNSASPSNSAARWLARASLTAPLAAFLLSCALNGVLRDLRGTAAGAALNWTLGGVMCGLLATGVTCGVAALWPRRGAPGRGETVLLALLGLALNAGAIALTAAAVAIAAQR